MMLVVPVLFEVPCVYPRPPAVEPELITKPPVPVYVSVVPSSESSESPTVVEAVYLGSLFVVPELIVPEPDGVAHDRTPSPAAHAPGCR